MSDATIVRPRRRAPEYVTNPDMAAFTIGQVALAALRDEGALSMETLRKYLARIAAGRDDAAATRVNPDMALGALRYIEASLRTEAA